MEERMEARGGTVDHATVQRAQAAFHDHLAQAGRDRRALMGVVVPALWGQRASHRGGERREEGGAWRPWLCGAPRRPWPWSCKSHPPAHTMPERRWRFKDDGCPTAADSQVSPRTRR